MGRFYRSKVDWWVGLILAVAVATLVGTGIALLVIPPPDAPLVRWIALVNFLVAVLVAWIPFSTHYTVTTTDLLVRSACFRWRIPLDRIVEVCPTHNPLSSPACSLDRLRVNYKRPSGRTWWVMISPREKVEFLDNLAEAAGLEKEVDRLVRLD